jgi:hypothetical protein
MLATSNVVVMQSAPGITPALVERIVASRTDLTKADIKEVCTGTADSYHAVCALYVMTQQACLMIANGDGASIESQCCVTPCSTC